MTSNINNSMLISLIKGLYYNSKANEYTYRHKKYKLRDVKTSEDKKEIEHYYFVNIDNPIDLVIVKVVKGIPAYDGFNDVKINAKLRKLAYQREYYKQVTIEKRKKVREEVKAEKEKLREKVNNKIKEIKKQETEQKICAFCGEEFTPTSKVQKFCSRECQRKYNSKQASEKKKTERKSEKVCPICNKTFVGNPRDTYCSKECYKVSQRDSRRERYNRDKSNGCYDKGGKYEYSKYSRKKSSAKDMQNNATEKSGYGRKIDW